MTTILLSLAAALLGEGDDAAQLAKDLVANTRGQASYEAAFSARLEPPAGDAIDYKGECVWVKPGVLFIHYTASGGDEKNIVRVGEKVWVHHPFAGWQPAEAMGLTGAARGMQNPDEVLGVLAAHLDKAEADGDDAIALTFAGPDIEKIMREQAQKGAFDWGKSRAAVRLVAGPERRLDRFACAASLVSTDAEVKGAVGYKAEVAVKAYNGKSSLEFKDEDGNAIELAPAIRKAVESLGKEKQ